MTLGEITRQDILQIFKEEVGETFETLKGLYRGTQT